MSSKQIEEFRRLREKMEAVIEKTKEWVEKKSILESSRCFEEAKNLLIKLRKMADDDQQRSVTNRQQGQPLKCEKN